MEEDDNDDFLGGVIEFGDGRQYTIQVNDPSKPDAVFNDAAEGSTAVADIPVSKECLVNDFNRIRPRSRHEQSVFDAPEVITNQSTRVLGVDHPLWKPRPKSQLIHPFYQRSCSATSSSNERSNRMKPYSGLNRPGFNGQHNSHQVPFKRNGDQVSHTHRLGRDA